MSARNKGSVAVRSEVSGRSAKQSVEDSFEPVDSARIEKQVGESVTEINRLMREIGGRFDEIGRHLFNVYFKSDVEAALSTGRQPLEYIALLQRAGDVLHATRSQLTVALRIAALSARLKNSKWVDLTWSTRVELLPLLGSDLDFEELGAGIRYANQHRTSMRQVREWVAKRLDGSKTESTEKPVVFTVPASEKLATTCNALSKSATRRKLISRFMDLPDNRRAAMLTNLKGGLRSLEKLTHEFEEAMASE
jgi:hypothetical protein